MKPTSAPPSGDAKKQANPLTEVLGQAEQVKDLIDECADGLSVVNTSLKQEAAVTSPQGGIEGAIRESELIEGKVQEAASKLAGVNASLETEVQARQELETRLATATKDEAAARHAALHDHLTGLPNRALFENRLELALIQAQRHDRTVALMFIDLVDFKHINDTYGHDLGDAVLQTISERLKDNTREDDTVCRLGGDEFLYLLAEYENEQSVAHVAEKIASAIEVPCTYPGATLTVRSSIGIATHPKNGTTANALIKSADQAMYKAKRSKTTCAFAD